MYKLTPGQCLNCLNGFVCTERRAHQNSPCPYGDLKKCPCYDPVTAENVKQWEETGIIIKEAKAT